MTETSETPKDPDVAELIERLRALCDDTSEYGIIGEAAAALQRQAEELAQARKLEDMLHTAICIATGMMNIGDNAPAHIILRQCLIDYADAARAQGEKK